MNLKNQKINHVTLKKNYSTEILKATSRKKKKTFLKWNKKTG